MIYVDNAATMRMSQAAIRAITPFLTDRYGNASSSHSLGRDASTVLNEARQKVATLIGAMKDEIVFTSGGSEANNQAIFSAAYNGRKNGKNRIIISAIEHDSVFNAAKRLENYGFEIIVISADPKGFINPKNIETVIDSRAALVSVMTANNEIGTIQPIKEIGEICRRHNVIFHTDAVQAAGHIHLNVAELNADMLSVSAHKFGGMMGVGALYIRKDVKGVPLICGGQQEMCLRAGTENITGIVAMAAALEDACNNLDEKNKRIEALRNSLIEKLTAVPKVRLNGDMNNRLAGNVNVSFDGFNSDLMLTLLDEHGICASSGAACHSAEGTPSRVLKAIGLSDDAAMSSVRFSLSNNNTEEEIDHIAETVFSIMKKNPLVFP